MRTALKASSLARILLRRLPLLLGVVASLGIAASPSSAQIQLCNEQAKNIKLVHYSGQTFITWDEVWQEGGTKGEDNESYNIYRSTQPIMTLAGLTPIYTVWLDSAEFYADRVAGIIACDPDLFVPRYADRFVVPCGSPCTACDPSSNTVERVPEGRGLLVWTPHYDGMAYYAVVRVSGATGIEEPCLSWSLGGGSGGNIGMVAETSADPLPVEVPKGCIYVDQIPEPDVSHAYVTLKRHVYIQYMDLANWNPTFHAPNALNCWWGEDPAEEKIKNAIQYAYTYVVVQARGSCEPIPSSGSPVVLYLHPRAKSQLPHNKTYWFATGCAVRITAIDPMDTWWYGFADYDTDAGAYDFRRGHLAEPACPSTDKCSLFKPDHLQDGPYPMTSLPGCDEVSVVNYTEFRLLRMIYDLARMAPESPSNPNGNLDPAFPEPIDLNRVYVRGQSMGGSGALSLATRYPNVFAAAACSKPMTNFRAGVEDMNDPPHHPVGHIQEWINYWGHPSDPLPIRNEGPGDYAVDLAGHDGESVWDWMDHAKQMVDRVDEDMVPFGSINGACDPIMPYPAQGFDPYPIFAEGKRCWGGTLDCTAHGGQLIETLPPGLGGIVCDATADPMFSCYGVVRDESVPGFSNIMMPPNPPPKAQMPCPSNCMKALYYHNIDWSSSWNSWHGPPLETACSWAISLRLVDPQICLLPIVVPPACPPGGTPQPATSPPMFVDITPRRLQQFEVCMGTSYRWTNDDLNLGGGGRIQCGTVLANSNEILTIPGVCILPEAGNRLTITELGPCSPSCP